MAYRRPGVYLEESLLVNPSDIASTTTVGCFIGVAQKGQLNEPMLVESWGDYVTLFGGFYPIAAAAVDPNDRTSRLAAPIPPTSQPSRPTPPRATTHYTGVAFNAGEFVTLTDASKAKVTGTAGASVWSAGAVTGGPTDPADHRCVIPALRRVLVLPERRALLLHHPGCADSGRPAGQRP